MNFCAAAVFSWIIIVTNINNDLLLNFGLINDLVLIFFLYCFYFFNIQGLEPGTVVITRRAVNALLEPFNAQVPSVYILNCHCFRGNKDYVLID